MLDIPTADLPQFFVEPAVANVTARCSIYESDGETLFMENVPLLDGSVSADFTRDERRTLDVTFDNVDGALRHPETFDYDKVIKVWRGVSTDEGDWETPLGTFYIDSIKSQHFPNTISVTCRDGAKRLLADKFATSTTFKSGQPIETIIRTIATNGGIQRINLAPTGKMTTRDHGFERGVSRWEAITEIAGAYNYDLYFDPAGFLVLQPQQDPSTSPPTFTFETGLRGSLASFDKKTSDARVYNHMVVTGAGVEPNVYATAENNDPASPTRIERIGRRTYQYTSQFIHTTAQCQDVADRFLAIHALEDYELSLSSLVLPWLEPGSVIRFLDPNPSIGNPEIFLLTDLSIPLRLGQMSVNAKRVVMR